MLQRLHPRPRAARIDKHALYERSVQDPEADMRFVARHFFAERGRPALHLREDFCGSAANCRAWVRLRRERTAVGVDLHAPTLAYARRRVADLGLNGRVQLVCADVRRATHGGRDVVLALNSSYCVFHERRVLADYFRRVKKSLVPDGAFFLDCQGGLELGAEVVERTRQRGFTYIWEQKPMDALSARGRRYIHFELAEGTRLRRAFRYDWRLWTLPELRELLGEVGFARVDVYWEGADVAGRGSGVFRRVQRVDNERSFVAWIVAWR